MDITFDKSSQDFLFEEFFGKLSNEVFPFSNDIRPLIDTVYSLHKHPKASYAFQNPEDTAQYLWGKSSQSKKDEWVNLIENQDSSTFKLNFKQPIKIFLVEALLSIVMKKTTFF